MIAPQLQQDASLSVLATVDVTALKKLARTFEMMIEDLIKVLGE